MLPYSIPSPHVDYTPSGLLASSGASSAVGPSLQWDQQFSSVQNRFSGASRSSRSNLLEELLGGRCEIRAVADSGRAVFRVPVVSARRPGHLALERVDQVVHCPRDHRVVVHAEVQGAEAYTEAESCAQPNPASRYNANFCNACSRMHYYYVQFTVVVHFLLSKSSESTIQYLVGFR